MEGPTNYRVLCTLGSGPLGTVSLAEDLRTGQKVALKLLSDEARRPEVAAALCAGERAAAALVHPGIPHFEEELPESAGLSREYAVGPTLREWLALPAEMRERIDPAGFGAQVAMALSTAHREGLVHGDLHPGNVLLAGRPEEAWRARVVDFGAAAAHAALSRAVAAGANRATPPGAAEQAEFVAPELHGGAAADEPADVYALGVILHKLLLASGGAMSTAPTLPSVGQDGGERGPLPARDLPHLLATMRARDPAERPDMARAANELSRLGQTSEGPEKGLEFPPDLPVQPGQCIGNYRLIRPIGAGGMGVVFEARHTSLSRTAAIKVLRPEFCLDREMVKRFFTEAEAVNIVRHPGIVDIFEFGEFGQLPHKTVFIVMEHLQGESLHHRLQRAGGRLGIGALRLMRQVASALAAAHEHDIVHRDLKPENVMIIADPDVQGGERAKLLDFGIAKMADHYRVTGRVAGAAMHKTQSGRAMGTPLYMSPEQCRDSGTVDDRADVYSLGVMIYEVLLGQTPFRAEGFAELASMHFFTPPRPLREVDPEVPETLAELVENMLAKAPADRPRMAEVAAALERILAAPFAPTLDGPTAAPAPASTTPSGQAADLAQFLAPSPAPAAAQSQGAWRARRLVLPLSLAAAALLLIGGLAGYRHGRREHPAVVPRPAGKEPVPKSPETSRKTPQEKPGPDLLHLRHQGLLVLEEGLHDGDPGLRRRAVTILGQSRDARHAALLEPLLLDGEAAVRTQVAAALAQLSARGSAAAILAAITPPARAGGARVEVEAAGALLQLGDPAGLLRLKKALWGRDQEAGRRAIELLAEHGDPKARRALSVLARKHPQLTEERIATLGRLARGGDGGARQMLLAALPTEGAPDEVQLRVAEELARGEEPHAEESRGQKSGRSLLEATAKEPGALKLLAARMLAGLDDPSYYALFLSRFGDPKSPLPERILSAEGLGACGRAQGAELLGKALPKEAGPLRLRMAAAGALLQIAASDPALLAQENLYLAEGGIDDERWQARQAAVAALGDAEPRLAVPLLGQAIRDRQPEVRQSAARALGRTRVRAAVPVLGVALDDTVRVVRTEAMHSIGQVGKHLRQHGERVDDLVGTVAGRIDRGDEGERLAGVSALLDLGDTSRRAELQKWLRSRDPNVRREAVEALSSLGEGPAAEADREVLTQALRDPVFAVRFTAAAKLSALGNDEAARAATPVLREALKSKGPSALIAQGLLRRLGDGAPGQSRFTDGELSARLQAIAAAPSLSADEATELLAQGARDPAVEVRRRAAEMAGALPGLVDAATLRTTLKGMLGDPDPQVRTRAGAVLTRLSEKATAGPDADEGLVGAQGAYARGDYPRAIALGRPVQTQHGFSVVGAAACRLHDGALALLAYGHLEDLTLRRSMLSICQHAGVSLRAGEAVEAGPPGQNESAVPTPPKDRTGKHGGPPAPEERNITNDRIKLPQKALHGTVEIDK